jgi:hypothetical protein
MLSGAIRSKYKPRLHIGALMKKTKSPRSFIIILSFVLGFSGLTTFVSGCFSNRQHVCEQWIEAGDVISSFDDCVQCAKTYGNGDLDGVRSCTFRKGVAALRRGD